MLRRFIAIFLLGCLGAFAQKVPGEYLVELEEAPLLDRRLTTEGRTARQSAILAEQTALRTRLTAMGADVFHSMTSAANLLAVRWQGSADALRQTAGVRAVYPVYKRYKSLDQARILHQLPEGWARVGGIENAGAGVKIGIIDSGIDPSHPGFQDETLTVPEGYPKTRRGADSVITNRKIIVARNYDDLFGTTAATSARDLDGHGTAVAMVAAGVETRANFATISGVAPKAFLGVYRVFPYDRDGTTDTVVLQAINDAIDDGMHVINLSLGASLSENSVDSVYASVFRRAAENGVVIVAAIGNSGPEPGTADSPGYLPEALGVGATAHRRTFDFPVTLRDHEFAGTLGAGRYGSETIEGEVADVRKTDASGLGCLPSAFSQVAGKIALIDRGDCTFEVKLTYARAAGATAAIVVNNVIGEPIPMGVASATLPAIMIRRSDGESLRALLAESPSENARVYFNGREVSANPRELASFSSRGPSVIGGLKPDLAAVGSYIYTATPTVSNSPQYTLINGTSFSSPLVAGAAAVLHGYRPGLTVQQYRSLLTGSAADWGPEGEREFLPTSMGSGLLRLDNALRTSIAASQVSLNFGVAQDRALQATRPLELFNLSSEADTLTVEIHWLSGQMPWTETNTLEVPAGESRTADIVVDLAGMESGVSMGIVLIRSALTGTTLRIPYWFAVPSHEGQRVDFYGAYPSPRAGVQTELLFRLFDTTGLPVTSSDIAAEGTTEGLSVIGLTSYDADAPGLYGLRLRPVSGVNMVTIKLGEFSQTVSFRAN